MSIKSTQIFLIPIIIECACQHISFYEWFALKYFIYVLFVMFFDLLDWDITICRSPTTGSGSI